MSPLLVFAAVLWAGLTLGRAQERLLPPPPPSVREVAPGVFQVGTLRLEKASRCVSFPATLNLNEGTIEYLLVTATGKTHESLLKTDTQPFHLHVAMLLLGAKGAGSKPLTNAPAGGSITAAQLAKFREQALPGEAVTIEVSWQTEGKEQRCRLEDLVRNRQTKAPMTKGDFTFNGSQMWQGQYVAQTEGSIVSAITDPDAVFNNPRPGRDADEVWHLDPKTLPPLGTKMQVTITLAGKAGKPEPAAEHAAPPARPQPR